eukprot:PhM_4_TR3005/c2_g1_i7/m.37573
MKPSSFLSASSSCSPSVKNQHQSLPTKEMISTLSPTSISTINSIDAEDNRAVPCKWSSHDDDDSNSSVVRNFARLTAKLVSLNQTNNLYFTVESDPFVGSAPIGIEQYIIRLHKNLYLSSSSSSMWIVAAVYLDRWTKSMKKNITSLNAHRLILGLVLVAWQYIEHEAESNNVSLLFDVFACAGGVSVGELVRIQRCVLRDLSWSLYVETTEFKKYENGLLMTEN